jgi:hypothetical protein
MQKREKILLCVMPYGLAAYLWFSLTSPALVAGQDKTTELEGKKQEKIELETKLFDLQRTQKAHAELEKEINLLRSSVPKSPDLDLLVIDIEKMCLDSGMDLVGLKPPEADRLQAMQKLEEESQSQSTASGKLALGAKSQDRNKPAKPADKAKPGEATTNETGLSKLVMECHVTGDYPGYITLMKRFETYERVVGVNHIMVNLPPPAGDKKTRDPKELDISFMLTAYYLP